MKNKILIALTLMGSSHIAFAQGKTDTTKLKHQPADIGLVYPLCTNGINAAHYSNMVSIQALVGVSGASDGCAVAGIGNIIKKYSNGVAIAGIFNLIGDSAKGAQIAGIFNTIGGNAKGTQIAGIANLVKGKTKGLQVAGIVNATDSIQGTQIAGIGNITSGKSKAVQVAGVFNTAKNASFQIAGLVNIAHKADVQVSGLINIADSSKYPIGFINLIKNGEKSIGISTTNNLNTLFSFYSGGKAMYGIIGVGLSLKSSNVYSFQAGMGAHIIQKKYFRLNAEASQLFQTDFENGHCFTYSLKALPEIKIGLHLAVFAGPALHLQIDYSNSEIPEIVNNHFWSTTAGQSNHFIGSYFGIVGGLKFIL